MCSLLMCIAHQWSRGNAGPLRAPLWQVTLFARHPWRHILWPWPCSEHRLAIRMDLPEMLHWVHLTLSCSYHFKHHMSRCASCIMDLGEVARWGDLRSAGHTWLLLKDVINYDRNVRVCRKRLTSPLVLHDLNWPLHAILCLGRTTNKTFRVKLKVGTWEKP